MRKKPIHIGTSGWYYAHWRGNFYPDEINSSEFLNYYIKKLNTVEINNSFYRLPDKSTLKDWHKKTPDNFIFSAKASRYITHVKKLKDPKKSTKKFFKTVEVLGKKLGPILFQLPPSWRPNPERLDNFLKVLPEKYKYTFEFRNSKWFNKKTYGILKKHKAAFCIYHLAGKLSPKENTADFIYIRLHGPKGAYEGSYKKSDLKKWVKNFLRWNKEGKEIFCYFDNDQAGFAVKNALELKEIIKNLEG